MEIKFLQFQVRGDDRGSLVALEEDVNIPFEIKRVYYMYDTLNNVRRGLHAHKNLKQVIIAMSGSCRILLDDGRGKCDIRLDSQESGLYLDSLIWREIYDFSSDCILMVLADSLYDEDDYIRDYSVFLKYIKGDM